MVATAVVATGTVLILNVAEVDRPRTVTELGRVTLLRLLDRETTLPPSGAGPVRVTVPVDWVPPTTEEGLTDTPWTSTGRIERTCDTFLPFADAVTVDEVFDVVRSVVTVKAPELAPAGTVRLAGTWQ